MIITSNLYSVGGVKKYLPPSQADGYERLSKHPKSSKLGKLKLEQAKKRVGELDN